MPKLDQVREFRHAAAPATDEARRRAHERLTQAIAAETQLDTAVGDKPTQRMSIGRWIVKRRTSVLALGLLVAAGAAALFVSAPWQNSPGFLERAEAALTPPAGSVLHEKIETTSTWTRPTCKVTATQVEIWIDTTPPNSYRVLMNDLRPDAANADPRTLECFSRTVSEIGGTYSSPQALLFVPPDMLVRSWNAVFRFPLDPAADLRAAIRVGAAHDEGKTQFDGRTVERVRIPSPACPAVANCPYEPAYLYVDPESYYPVGSEVTTSQTEIAGGPRGSSYRHVRVHDITRFRTFEYLPRTEANLALTDIRAQHPNATGP